MKLRFVYKPWVRKRVLNIYIDYVLKIISRRPNFVHFGYSVVYVCREMK